MDVSRPKFPWLFLAISYAFSWLIWFIVASTGIDYQTSPLLVTLLLLGIFGPGFAGIILTYREEGREGGRDFWKRVWDVKRIQKLWWLLILLFWPALHGLALGLTAVFGADLPQFTFIDEMIAQPLGIPVIIVLYFIQALLEELGWRGYFLDRVQARFSTAVSSLIVGVWHALWHLPMFWIVGTNQYTMGISFEFLIWVAEVFAFSVISSWCYNANSRSTLAVTLLHTMGNLSLDIFTYVPGSLKRYLFSGLMVALSIGILVSLITQPTKADQ